MLHELKTSKKYLDVRCDLPEYQPDTKIATHPLNLND